MQVKFRQKFDKDLDNILNADVLNAIVKVIELVEKVSKPQDIPNLKKMSGFKSFYRIRVGNYRIGIEIDKNTVEFQRVLLRDKIYKYFPK